MDGERNLAVVLAYDGTGFHGWQRQAGFPTIQSALEEKLKRVTGESVNVIAAGRTDAGVHATGQVVNFRTTGTIPTERLAIAINSLPPFQIVARRVRLAGLDFHARYDAYRRTYRYYLWRDGVSPFLMRYTCPVPWLTADGIERMKLAAPALLGTQDFSSFTVASAETRTRVRTLYSLEISERGPLVRATLVANAFLQGMVRNIMGTLLEVASQKRSVDSLPQVLAARDRTAAGESAPARGLFLTRVEYQR